VTQWLRAQGYADAYALRGGMDAWMQNDGPVELTQRSEQ